TRNGRASRGHDQGKRREGAIDPARSGGDGVMADASRSGWREGRQTKGGDGAGSADNGPRGDSSADNGPRGDSTVLGDASCAGGGWDTGVVPEPQAQDQGGGHPHRRVCDLAIPAGATGGFWAGADWVLCRDPTGGPPVARPVEPGTFPLASRVPGRVG